MNGSRSERKFCEYGFMVTEIILRGDVEKSKKYMR
jgi:hypothetical protein